MDDTKEVSEEKNDAPVKLKYKGKYLFTIISKALIKKGFRAKIDFTLRIHY